MQANTPKALSIIEFKEAVKEGALLIDTRSSQKFMEAFIPGSVFSGAGSRFQDVIQDFVSKGKNVVAVTNVDNEQNELRTYIRAGANVIGYLEGGFDAWLHTGEKTDMLIDVDADELIMDIPHDPKLIIIDVSNEFEFESMHVKDAVNLPLEELSDIAEIANYSDENNIYFVCNDGIKSVVAASLFKRHGLHNVRVVNGGMESVQAIPTAEIIRNKSTLN
jgi:rhodanese-related sulfurtransferase